MANVVIMPRQGQSVESCIITSWQKKKGDHVEVKDILFSYETDKSAFDEPSQFAGTLLEILWKEGDVVPCLEPVCIIGEEGEDISSLLNKGAKEPEAGEKKETETAKAEEKKAPEAEAVPTESDGSRVFISPRARKLAVQSGADLSKAVPTGPHGRIIERDVNKALDSGFVTTGANVEAFLEGRPVQEEEKAEAPAAQAAPAAPAASAEDLRAYTEEPLSNIRKVIAKSMHASLSEMAQLTLNSSFNAKALLDFRAKLKAGGEELGLGKITINDMILYAVSRVLPNYPEINANLVDSKFRRFAHANVGMAVDTDRGLLVPVVFGAEKMTLAAISATAKTLAGKAREGKLTPDEMSGGSFTVSNLGSMGVESFTPVINPPQTAILGVCCTVNRLDAEGKVYPAMGLSLTFDHRAVDGAPAARFLKELCTALENFDLLLAK